MSDYAKNERIRSRALFRDADDPDSMLDPTTVKFTYRVNGGSATVLTYGSSPLVIRDATGAYHVDLDLTTTGTWERYWSSTGTARAVEPPKSFQVVDTF